MGVMDGLRSWGEPMIDEHAKVLGAECKLYSSVAMFIEVLTDTLQMFVLKVYGMITTSSMAEL